MSIGSRTHDLAAGRHELAGSFKLVPACQQMDPAPARSRRHCALDDLSLQAALPRTDCGAPPVRDDGFVL